MYLFNDNRLSLDILKQTSWVRNLKLPLLRLNLPSLVGSQTWIMSHDQAPKCRDTFGVNHENINLKQITVFSITKELVA